MSSLLSIIASPSAAATAIDAIGTAVGAATRPFADVLAALTSTEVAAGPADKHDDSEAAIGERLQELLTAAGVEAGQCATVCYDAVADRVDVDHSSPLAGDVAEAIADDAQLMDQLRAWAQRDASSDRLELLVQVA